MRIPSVYRAPRREETKKKKILKKWRKSNSSNNNNSIGTHTHTRILWSDLVCYNICCRRLCIGYFRVNWTMDIRKWYKWQTKIKRNKFTTLWYHIMYDAMPKRGPREETNRKIKQIFSSSVYLCFLEFFFFFWLWMQNVWIAYADILLFIYMEYRSGLSYIVQYVSHSHDVFRFAHQKLYMANGDAWALSSFPLILVSLLLLLLFVVYFVHRLCCNTNARSFLWLLNAWNEKLDVI